jgi:hypothetical protein
MKLERLAALTALLSALLVGGMITLGLTRGVTQEFFEAVHPVADYTARLLHDGPVLRLVFGFDNLFLVAYSLFFLLFARLRRGQVDGLLLGAGAAAMLLTGLLDCLENQHIVMLLNSAERGVAIGAEQIQWQAVESQVKFGVSYFGVVLFALAFPRRTLVERSVALGTGVVYPILGVAALSAPAPLLPLLGLARVLFFLTGFLATAWVLLQASRGVSGPAAGSAPAP